MFYIFLKVSYTENNTHWQCKHLNFKCIERFFWMILCKITGDTAMINIKKLFLYILPLIITLTACDEVGMGLNRCATGSLGGYSSSL